jgi:hypothetical protein
MKCAMKLPKLVRKSMKTCANYEEREQKTGLDRDLNPGPLAPKAKIIPLDHQATFLDEIYIKTFKTDHEQ